MKTKDKKKPAGNNRKRLVLAAAALLLILGGMWFFRSNPVDEVRSLRAQLFSKNQELSPEERQELSKKMRDQMKELTPEQRREVFSDLQKKKAQEMTQFFKLASQDQQKELDKKIDKMVARMNQPRGPGQGGMGAPGSNQGGANPPGGPMAAGIVKSSTPEEREERRQRMLDYSTPDFRAQMFEYRQMFQNRMNERGLPMPAPAGPKRF